VLGSNTSTLALVLLITFLHILLILVTPQSSLLSHPSETTKTGKSLLDYRPGIATERK
jgi:hypothetical protein